jgi:hypothetical protein
LGICWYVETSLCKQNFEIFSLTLIEQGSPIAGYILEASGGANNGIAPYRPAMYFAGSLSLASATLIAIVRMRRQRELSVKA